MLLSPDTSQGGFHGYWEKCPCLPILDLQSPPSMSLMACEKTRYVQRFHLGLSQQGWELGKQEFKERNVHAFQPFLDHSATSMRSPGTKISTGPSLTSKKVKQEHLAADSTILLLENWWKACGFQIWTHNSALLFNHIHPLVLLFSPREASWWFSCQSTTWVLNISYL